MFNLQHCMPLHWEYNPKNAPRFERKWGINLVWKWQHGVHVFNFVVTFIDFEKEPTMITIACCSLCLNPNDGHLGFFILGCDAWTIPLWNKYQQQVVQFTKGSSFKWMFSICLRMCRNMLIFQFHGQIFYKVVQGCLFN